MKERLHKFLARSGVASRRAAERLIAEGRISINGTRVVPPAPLIDPDTDRVEVDGSEVKGPESFVYYALNKPVGYVCTVRDRHAEKTVMDLVPSQPPVYPVGRLDRDSSGLLILTNDGDLAQRLTHPSFRHEKEYSVAARWLKPLKPEEAGKLVRSLEKGVVLEEGRTSPCRINLLHGDGKAISFRIILTEGWKRQIRRMCDVIGLQVLELKRVRVAGLTLGPLNPGSYRALSRSEILGGE
jgi:pseudouridine synthase